MVYPALLPLMRTPRPPVVDWTDAPTDLNGLVRFAERRNMVSARMPSHFILSLRLNAFTNVKCTEAGNMWGITGLYIASRPALKNDYSHFIVFGLLWAANKYYMYTDLFMPQLMPMSVRYLTNLQGTILNYVNGVWVPDSTCEVNGLFDWLKWKFWRVNNLHNNSASAW
jgi:hypothetical protein